MSFKDKRASLQHPIITILFHKIPILLPITAYIRKGELTIVFEFGMATESVKVFFLFKSSFSICRPNVQISLKISQIGPRDLNHFSPFIFISSLKKKLFLIF
jgi:hypothetical protein